LKTAGKVSLAEMRRVFNIGIGMIAVVGRDDVESVRRAAQRVQVKTWIIGEIVAGETGVRFTER
jgi:phosphoribosylformylglycinamidine cyclo-ligase